MAKRRGVEFWRRHLESWHRSELTQKAYCASHGLSPKSFYRWHCREKQGALAKPGLTLVPISVEGAEGADTKGVVRLHSPGGWRIELPADASWLAQLLRQLP